MVYEVIVPDGVEVNVTENEISVKGKLGELKRSFDPRGVNIKKDNSKFVLTCKSVKRKNKALVGTTTAHMKNMIKGVTESYKYTLKIVYAHFPVNVSVEKDKVVIKNFAGEKSPRYADIVDDTKVTVKGHEIIVSNINIDKAGQTAANIEQATRIRKRDLRVFGDGIYITSKAKPAEKVEGEKK